MRNLKSIIGVLAVAMLSVSREQKHNQVITVRQPKKNSNKKVSVKNHKSKPSTKYKGTKPIVSAKSKSMRRKT